MNKKDFKTVFALAKIAKENKEGFTVTKDLKTVCAGFAVSVAGTQNSFGFAGLANVVKYANEHKEINAFGGWYDSESEQFYFDATVICSTKEKAIELGRINKQIAIFDLNNMQEIRL